ncbi:MAG: AAA family ATPase [Gammaproteobacteria bacterium]
MIITAIRAENVLKYAHLELNGLPGRGLIAVSGRNESGKSTIGETICFALFGRTFSLSPEELIKIIHWGETRCLVAIDFTTGDGREYRVERSLDDSGNQGARLLAVDKDEPRAQGAEAVTAEVVRLAGFGYNEFIESFYLAQREITTPHGHSAAVKAMAGLTPLEKVQAQLGEEIKTLTDDMINAERDMADLNDRLTELNLNPDRLHSLWADLSATGTEYQEKSTRARMLRHVADQCRDSVAALKADAAPILKASTNTSYQGWTAHAERLAASTANLDRYCAQREAASGAADSTATLKDFVQHLQSQLSRFAQMKEGAGAYRARLAELLGEREAGGEQTGQQEQSLPAKKIEVNREAESATGSRKTARILTGVFLILAAALWALWVLLFQMPSTPAGAPVVNWFDTNVPGWENYNVGLLWLAVGATVLFVLLLIRGMMLTARINRFHDESARLDRRIEATREEAAALDSLDTMPLPDAVEALRNASDERLAAQATEYRNDSTVTLLDHDSLNDYRRLLTSLTDRTGTEIEATRAGIANEVSDLDRDTRSLTGTMAQLNEAIPEEQERRRKVVHLRSLMTGLQTKVDDDRRKIEVRNVARELLEDGCRHVSRRFNHDIRNLVGATLPLLTADRYEHLQIDEALRVRVFSGQKHDFLNLDEISSGTQRQIMLAVRLALSQKLVHTAIDGSQFMFLDEPFAFFDQQRMRDSLQVLPTLSQEVTQVWVIAQEFPEDAQFDLHIRCEHALTEMRINAA